MEQSNKNATILVIFACMPSFSHLSKLFLKIVSSFVDSKEDKKNKVSSFSAHVWAMDDLPTLTGPLTRKFTRVHLSIQLPIFDAGNIVFEFHECNNSCSVLMDWLLLPD